MRLPVANETCFTIRRLAFQGNVIGACYNEGFFRVGRTSGGILRGRYCEGGCRENGKNFS